MDNKSCLALRHTCRPGNSCSIVCCKVLYQLFIEYRLIVTLAIVPDKAVI